MIFRSGLKGCINLAAFLLLKFCCVREVTGLTKFNLIYCCNMHEEDIFATENCSGLYPVDVDGAGLPNAKGAGL